MVRRGLLVLDAGAAASDGSDGGGRGNSGVTWWIIAIAVIAAVAAVAIGVLAAFLVRRKGRAPPLEDDPEGLLKVKPCSITPLRT
jgi:anti-sigma-K factor RskA